MNEMDSRTESIPSSFGLGQDLFEWTRPARCDIGFDFGDQALAGAARHGILLHLPIPSYFF